MDPILQELYSTILAAAPFVIAAYVLMWVVLLVYIIYTTLGLKKAEKQLAALEEAVGQNTKDVATD